MKSTLNAALCCWTLLLSPLLVSQAGNPPPVSTAFAVLVKKLDTKTATLNQEFDLRTIADVVVDGRIVIPKGSRVISRVAEISMKGQDNQESILAVTIDKAVMESGRELPLQAIIAAVAAPQDDSLTSDPAYGMMHSNEPKMVTSGPTGSVRSGDLSSSSKVESTAPVATARLKGRMDGGLILTHDSQGAIGISDLTLYWRLTTPPAVTVFSSKGKNIQLNAGTQILIRMATPQSAR